VSSFRLDFAAVSDVGRVRKDNQDSGYAGPWLLAVCDGVGGAARGDLASSTAVGQIRKLDEEPVEGRTDEDELSLVSHALFLAHDRIAELVDHDPSLNGTSTTATVALFDGDQLAMGHVGDSRAYLFREGAVTQLTHDHTFVQSLIDEGRITEEEARVHPHRNLILKALDGMREVEPDLFIVDLQAGDRIMLCSDGVSGSLTDGRLADVLRTGSPDYAATELVRASMDAGSTDNVTCLVADVVTPDAVGEYDEEPLLVGSAAELPRKHFGAAATRLFRGHRMGDTGELEPIDDDFDLPPDAIASDPLPEDPEELRYRLRPPRRFAWLRRVLMLFVVVGLVWVAAAIGWRWTQTQWYVGEQDGKVAIYRGVHDVLGVDLSKAYSTYDLDVTSLAPDAQAQLAQTVHEGSLADAERWVLANAPHTEQQS
jgi:PPM family protein phosphatase